MKGYVLDDGEGRSYDWNDGFMFTVKAAGAETGGALAFMDFESQPGQEPPVHRHDDEDEIFYVLEGSLTLTCGDDTLHARERSFIFLPRNVPHGYTITSERVRMLVLTAPSGFGDRIEATGKRIGDIG